MCVLKSTFAFKIGIALCALFMVVVPATTADATGGRPEDPSHALRAVEEAAAELVAKEDGPPGVIVVIQRAQRSSGDPRRRRQSPDRRTSSR